MRLSTTRTAVLACLAGLCLSTGALAQPFAESSEFTYQGVLKDGVNTANGNYDIQFLLFNDATVGSQVGGTITKLNTAVAGGLLTTTLDFGNVWTSTQLWLEIRIRPAGGGAYTTLTPRTKATGSPSSLSLRLPASSTANISGTVLAISNSNNTTTAGGISATSGTGPLVDITGYYTPALLAQSSAGNGLIATSNRSSAYALFGFADLNAAVAVVGRHEGTGGAGTFTISNATNGSTALVATTNGTGRALQLSTTLATNAANTLQATQSGTGRVAFFDSNNAAATLPAVEVNTDSDGANENTSNAGVGIKAVATGAFGVGIYCTGPTAGVHGVAGSSSGAGVWGETQVTGGEAVRGSTGANGAAGVAGYSNFGTGIYGQTSSGYGVYGSNGGGAGYAVYSNGKMHVNGVLTKNSGAFRIDHPLDPANMYLQHSFVESPDMKNIYDGLVTLDEHGEAVVEMPKWFEALNAEFRYQLTCVGGFAQVYIAEEMHDRHFKIAGGKPGMKVSWQVTGNRIDPFARDNPITTELPKSGDEQGKYLYPKGYGAGSEKQIGPSGNAPVYHPAH